MKEILRYKPEAVFADNAMFSLYPTRPCTAKKTYPNPYRGRKRWTETSGTDSLRFLKSARRIFATRRGLFDSVTCIILSADIFMLHIHTERRHIYARRKI